MATSTITSKGQVTIPKKIRDLLGLQPGDTLHFEIEADSKVSVTPAKKTADETFGLLYRKEQEAFTVEEMDAGVAEYFKRKYKTK